jgi:putative flippase GtrA
MLVRIGRYFIVGSIAASVDIGIFFVFAKLVGVNYLVVATVGFVIATFVNYLVGIRMVFESGVRFSKHLEILLVYLTSVIGLVINLLVLFAMVGTLHAELMFSKVVATVSVFFWNFIVRHSFIFRESIARGD